MKKISLLTLILALCTVFCACGTTTDPTQEPTEAPTEDVELYDIEYNYKDYIKTLAVYNGAEIEMYPKAEATDIIAMVRSDLAEADIYKKVTDRAVEEDDLITIEFVGYIDGEQFEGGSTNEPIKITVGHANYIDGFEDGLVGAIPSEDTPVVLELTFPEDYGVDELNGKQVVFEVTVHCINEQFELDELTDEIVAEVSDSKTVDEYISDVTKKIEESYHQDRVQNKQSHIMAQIIKDSEFSSLPEQLYNYYYDYFVDYYRMYYTNYQSMLSMYYGINSFTEFIEDYFGSQEKFYDVAKENAEDNCKFDLVCKAITDKENLMLTDEEYYAGIDEYLASGDFDDYNFESRQDFIDEFTEGQIHYTLQNQKVLDFITSNSIEK